MAAKNFNNAPKTSKTAHVMNLLSKKQEPAVSPETQDESAPAVPPILSSIGSDAAVSVQIKNALEDSLESELDAAPETAENASGPVQPEEPVPPPAQPDVPPVQPEQTAPPEPAVQLKQAAPTGPAAQPEKAAPAGPAAQPEQAAPAGPAAQPKQPAPAGPAAQPEKAAPAGPAAQPEKAALAGPAAQPEQSAPAEPAAQPEQPAPQPIQPDPVISASVQTAQPSAPQDEDSLSYINVMQVLVEEKAAKYIQLFGLCQCPRCQEDVKALTLNHLPPKYVVMGQGEVIPKLTFYEAQYSSDITAQLLHACKTVMKSPHHNR